MVKRGTRGGANTCERLSPIWEGIGFHHHWLILSPTRLCGGGACPEGRGKIIPPPPPSPPPPLHEMSSNNVYWQKHLISVRQMSSRKHVSFSNSGFQQFVSCHLSPSSTIREMLKETRDSTNWRRSFKGDNESIWNYTPSRKLEQILELPYAFCLSYFEGDAFLWETCLYRKLFVNEVAKNSFPGVRTLKAMK